MATTDAKPGFRLPWSADRSESDARAETTGDAPIGEAVPTDQEIETPDMIDAAPAATDHTAVDEGSAVSETTAEGDQQLDSSPEVTSSVPTTEPAAAGRKPNKFMADLTRAMQGAAETERAETLARLNADAKEHIESIHASTAVEAGELRKQADDDVASIREWSKAEIARIREETDERITHRKSRLEREIEAHAADIEARIERVQRRVDVFEAEMAAFFERLLAEEDATRFAAMAESQMPEPPSFDDLTDETNAAGDHTAEAVDLPAERAVQVDPWPDAPTEAVAEPPAGSPAEAEETAGDATVFEAEAEADASIVVDDQPSDTEPVAAEAETETDTFESLDPRLGALGLTPDFAAAEAEAAAFTPEEVSAEEEIAVIGDDALAARLAGLVPDAESGSEALTTKVVVTGLVSVASIAGFKRQLSRVAGVQSVGVSSGPDGEFLFSVTHDTSLVLRDAVTTLPGFGARVTAEAENQLTVTAKDPEAEG